MIQAAGHFTQLAGEMINISARQDVKGQKEYLARMMRIAQAPEAVVNVFINKN